MRALWLVGLLIWLCPVSMNAQALPASQVALFSDFASDVSGGDPDVQAIVDRFTSAPPTIKEEIGFYGLEDAPPAEWALRGIITQLVEAGHLIAVEDKYMYELANVLSDAGFADLPQAQSELDLIGYFKEFNWDAGITNDQWRAFKAWFPGHTRAVEQAVVAKGFTLLSLQLPLGDTLYFWAAPPEIADKWRNTAVYAGVNSLRFQRSPFVLIKVTDPAWAEYWGLMTYALNIPKAYRSVPDGI
jgi:hypothetical protein